MGRGRGETGNGGNGREGVGMPEKGLRRGGEKGRRRRGGRGGKKVRTPPPSIPAYARL